MNGSLTFVSYPNCRCPDTHPKLSPKNSFFCMKNGLYSGDLDLVNRLSLTSYPPEYMVDGVMSSYWLSEQKESVTIDFSLKYSNLQVILTTICSDRTNITWLRLWIEHFNYFNLVNPFFIILVKLFNLKM